MPGDFDFDDEPAPKKRRRGDDDDEDDDRDEPAPRRRTYGGPAGRMPGRVRIGFGGLICAAGGFLALVALVLPAGWGDTSVSDVGFSRRVWIWALGALVVGGTGARVREMEKASAGDFMLAGLNLIGGLFFALMLVVVGYFFIDEAGLKGIGVWALVLASLMVAGGTVLRLIEQFLRWGKKSEPAKRRRDDDEEEEDEDERPKAKKKPRRDEEEDEGSRPKAKKPKPKPRDEEEDEEEPHPKAKKPRPRDEDDEPRPKPKPKPKRPPEDLPDE